MHEDGDAGVSGDVEGSGDRACRVGGERRCVITWLALVVGRLDFASSAHLLCA